MSQIPRPVLHTVVVALGAVALFGLGFGYMAAAGKHQGFAQDTAPVASGAADPVVEAKPMDPGAATPPDVPTEEELAAKKAEDDQKKADAAKKAADEKAAQSDLPTGPQAYIPPPPVAAPSPDAPASPGSVEGPPPPSTPAQNGPGLY